MRIGDPSDGDDSYDVGVESAVGDLISISNWIYVGDDLGNLTAISRDRWVNQLGPRRDHTGGCINERGSHTIPCATSVMIQGSVKTILKTSTP